MNPEEVKQKIIAELELGALPEQQQDKIIAELADVLLERITILALSQLPEADVAELDALLQAGSQEEVAKRLQMLLPDLPQLAEKVIQDGIAEYKQLLAEELAGKAATNPTDSPAQAPAAQAEQVAATSADADALAYDTVDSPESAASQPDSPSTVLADIDDPAKAAELAATLPPQDPLAAQAPQTPAAEELHEEHLVVNEAGEAVPAPEDAPLINPNRPTAEEAA